MRKSSSISPGSTLCLLLPHLCYVQSFFFAFLCRAGAAGSSSCNAAAVGYDGPGWTDHRKSCRITELTPVRRSMRNAEQPADKPVRMLSRRAAEAQPKTIRAGSRARHRPELGSYAQPFSRQSKKRKRDRRGAGSAARFSFGPSRHNPLSEPLDSTCYVQGAQRRAAAIRAVTCDGRAEGLREDCRA